MGGWKTVLFMDGQRGKQTVYSIDQYLSTLLHTAASRFVWIVPSD